MTTSVPPRFAAARGLLTDELGRWLLVRDDRPHWLLPGGWIEPGERPRRTCEREVFQETGVEVVAGEPLVIACQDSGWSLVFDCGRFDSRLTLLDPSRDPEQPKTAECRWAPPAEALELLKPAIAARMAEWVCKLGRPGPVYVE